MDHIVSIIMPTYNSASYIAESIESVISQTYQAWELIIIDDHSTDNTQEIVTQYTKDHTRVKYIRLPENSGAAVARTTGIDAANGHYIAFLDSDDLWHHDKLALQLEFMQRNNYNISCTSYVQISESGDNLMRQFAPKTRATYNDVLLSCPIGNSTVIYNAFNLGKFIVPNIRKRNDDALWLQLLKREKYIHGLPVILAHYRIRTNALSRNKLSLIKFHWILYRDIEKLSRARSIFHICFWVAIKLLRFK